MNTRTKSVIAAAVLVVVAAGFFFSRSGPTPRPTASAASRRGARVLWPEGKRYLYSLSWRAKTAGEISPGKDAQTNQDLTLESSIEGEIALERASGSSSHAVVALSWTRLDHATFGAQGQEAQGDLKQLSAQLVDQVAFLDIDDRGRVNDIAFPTEMNPSVRAILRSVALELRYTLPELEVAEWEATERDSLGELAVKYKSGAKELAREAVKYLQLDAVHGPLTGPQELRGGAMLTLDENHLLTNLQEAFSAVYTRPQGTSPAIQSAWTFTLARTGAQAARTDLEQILKRTKSQAIAQQVDDPDREHRRDVHMAEGMTPDRLLLTMDRFEGGTKLEHDFLMKAAAYLRLHPEELGSLEDKFKSSALTVRGRGLILDVLAQTGSTEAQASMRTMLSTDAARAKPRDFSILVQRFTFVLAPERGSIEFLEKEYAQAAHNANIPAAQGTVVALGSAVRRLDGQQDHALAGEVNERLRRELREAKTPEMKGALVAALGNAGRAEDVPDLVAVAADPDARVRGQVASALRTVDSKEARAGLLSMITDPSTMVASTALGSLQKQTLGDDDWRSLADTVKGGKTTVMSDSAMVDLIKSKGKERPEGREVLSYLLTRQNSPDSDLPAIIRDLLKEKRD
ncbi:MAG: hypothetical protein JST92_09870 [Deltaproteobacteria bacterium]|nr:hypothetical protein [Deltaproteobacteria bacterium]